LSDSFYSNPRRRHFPFFQTALNIPGVVFVTDAFFIEQLRN
jgi:hypothetical protein